MCEKDGLPLVPDVGYLGAGYFGVYPETQSEVVERHQVDLEPVGGFWYLGVETLLLAHDYRVVGEEYFAEE